MHDVVVYSRKECHLCDVVKETLKQVQREADFQWREVDIDADPNYGRSTTMRFPSFLSMGARLSSTAWTGVNFSGRWQGDHRTKTSGKRDLFKVVGGRPKMRGGAGGSFGATPPAQSRLSVQFTD